MSIYTIDTHATRTRLDIQDEVFEQFGENNSDDADEIADTAQSLHDASIVKDDHMTLHDAVYIAMRAMGSIKWADFAEEFINSAKAFQK